MTSFGGVGPGGCLKESPPTLGGREPSWVWGAAGVSAVNSFSWRWEASSQVWPPSQASQAAPSVFLGCLFTWLLT